MDCGGVVWDVVGGGRIVEVGLYRYKRDRFRSFQFVFLVYIGVGGEC